MLRMCYPNVLAEKLSPNIFRSSYKDQLCSHLEKKQSISSFQEPLTFVRVNVKRMERNPGTTGLLL